VPHDATPETSGPRFAVGRHWGHTWRHRRHRGHTWQRGRSTYGGNREGRNNKRNRRVVVQEGVEFCKRVVEEMKGKLDSSKTT
jgi:hypothetical protein